MYCLDTSVVIDIFRGNEKVIKEVEKIWTEKIYITSITLSELFKGAYGHVNYLGRVEMVEDFLQNVEVLSLDIVSCKYFGFIWQNLKVNGRQVGDFDCLIASIVKTNGLTLITSDKHFENFDISVLFV